MEGRDSNPQPYIPVSVTRSLSGMKPISSSQDPSVQLAQYKAAHTTNGNAKTEKEAELHMLYIPSKTQAHTSRLEMLSSMFRAVSPKASATETSGTLPSIRDPKMMSPSDAGFSSSKIGAMMRLGIDFTQGWKARPNPSEVRKDMKAHTERIKRAAEQKEKSCRRASCRVAPGEHNSVHMREKRGSVRVKGGDNSPEKTKRIINEDKEPAVEAVTLPSIT